VVVATTAAAAPLATAVRPAGGAEPDNAGFTTTTTTTTTFGTTSGSAATTAPLTMAGQPDGVLSRSAHVTYATCPAAAVVLTVGVPEHSFVSRAVVTLRISLHNLSKRSCGPSMGQRATPQPVPLSLLGPCSALFVTVENAQGVDVYPASIAYDCPEFLPPTLGPHATLTTTGTWDTRLGIGALGTPSQKPGVPWTIPPVPAGRYRVTVAGQVTVPVVLVAQGAGSSSAAATP